MAHKFHTIVNAKYEREREQRLIISSKTLVSKHKHKSIIDSLSLFLSDSGVERQPNDWQENLIYPPPHPPPPTIRSRSVNTTPPNTQNKKSGTHLVAIPTFFNCG